MALFMINVKCKFKSYDHIIKFFFFFFFRQGREYIIKYMLIIYLETLCNSSYKTL